MIKITASISLNDDEVEEQFIRSPGSGGQKVNKTESAVQLRFYARKSKALSNAIYLRLKVMTPSLEAARSITIKRLYLRAHLRHYNRMN